jgi:hypothetical protein
MGKRMTSISGYEVQGGDAFVYGGRTYHAVQDAWGEFNAYVMVEPFLDGVTRRSVVIIRHGDTVEVAR